MSANHRCKWAAFALIALACLLSPTSGWADPSPVDTDALCVKVTCDVWAAKPPSQESKSSLKPRPARPPNGGGSTAEDRHWAEAHKAARQFERMYAIFEREYVAYTQCIRKATTTCGQPVPPDPYLLSWGSVNRGGGPPVIQITPAQAAAIAVARLQLPTIAPGIGPSPDLNRWKMAAVGYPLWLWADGPTHVGPVSDSVAGLSVSLEARVSSLSFRMGDGNMVECSGAGDKWTTAVEPGTKAPRCGYTYTEPSLPKGRYTVSALADWAVTWTANSQSGVINVPAVQTTELPVGELQVLVR
jgi:hypothetical protein